MALEVRSRSFLTPGDQTPDPNLRNVRGMASIASSRKRGIDGV